MLEGPQVSSPTASTKQGQPQGTAREVLISPPLEFSRKEDATSLDSLPQILTTLKGISFPHPARIHPGNVFASPLALNLWEILALLYPQSPIRDG